ncbi:MAG: RnfABCDGE type electron transport complex subunit B [Clostridia bacterium]|nr:RnfABCDGE type electron transport complex subunit B [Clostridia bacterium]
MRIEELLFPLLWFALLGGGFGLVLAIAARAFAVKRDERIPKIEEVLPGANCGGCGYTGCAAYAEAVCKGEASPGRCAVGGKATSEAIAAIMGVEATPMAERRARILCCGDCDIAKEQYKYEGAADCAAAARLGGGPKSCPASCVGLGSCAAVCPFGAIHVENGLATVDDSICVGCGVCMTACPKHLIHLVPIEATYAVLCSSNESGKETRAVCDTGCIGCRICEKKCEAGAIRVENNLATINYDLCTGCGACAEACPRKIIKKL